MQKVLIIEDDLMIADMLEEVLSLDSFEVCGIARNMQHALSLAATHKPELAIVDVFLADGSLGTDIAAVLIDLYDTGILYSTANTDALNGARGHGSMRKPFHLYDVPTALHNVAELRTKPPKSGPLPSLPTGLSALPTR
jgi:response regulator of citrate/malate metabolism